MNIVNITLGVDTQPCSSITLGRRGENEVTQVVVDFSSWVEEFGAGVITLLAMRSQDTSAYPVVLSLDGNTATWDVTSTDTAYKGSGRAEYIYTVGEQIAKSVVFNTVVMQDIGEPSETPPDPYEDWLERLTELGAETQANAEAAQQSAEDAEQSAQEAAQEATNAEDAAEKAETASKHYPVIVDNYWWVWRVEEEAYVNTGVKAEGQDFTIKGTVATVADLPSEAEQGDFWNVGTHEPYTMYMYQVGEGWINQGSLKGPTGTTFVPSVSEEGIISWTNDGDLPNPETRNIRGPQGEQGVKGEAGDSAGFGVPTATVDQTIGQASVSVSASGPDTAKVFNFEFSGIKGETGNGITGVSLVSTSGLDKTYRITFAETSPFEFVVHDGRGISSVVLNADYTLTINFTDGTNWTTPNSIRGEKGETGQKGETGTTFTPSVSSDGVISWTNDGGLPNPTSVNIKGPQGEQGVKGNTGEAAGFGTPTASVTQTIGEATVVVTATGPDTAKVFDFKFSGIKGEKGDKGDKGETGDTGATGPQGAGLKIMGTVPTVADLPASPAIGDAYGVGAAAPFDIYIYGSDGWKNFGPLVLAVDDALSDTSTNPVQNKVITQELAELPQDESLSGIVDELVEENMWLEQLYREVAAKT